MFSADEEAVRLVFGAWCRFGESITCLLSVLPLLLLLLLLGKRLMRHVYLFTRRSRLDFRDPRMRNVHLDSDDCTNFLE